MKQRRTALYQKDVSHSKNMIRFHSQVSDRTLPHMVEALDSTAMRSMFNDVLFRSVQQPARYRISACRVVHARYKPGQNCLISYALTIHDRHNDSTHEQLCSGRMYETGLSESRFVKAQFQQLAAPGFGPAVFQIPRLSMVFWMFPNDRKLANLPLICNRDYLRNELLPQVVSTGFGPDQEIAGIKDEIVHYVAEHSCTIRISMDLRRKSRSDERKAVIYGKTYYNDEGAETARLMDELWAGETRPAMARPLLYQPEARVLWQEGLNGHSLYELSGEGRRFQLMLKSAGATLAGLHRSTISCQRQCRLSDLTDRLLSVEGMVERLFPGTRARLMSLVHRLAELAEIQGLRPTALLHGDLHLKNFLVTPTSTAIIDLDTLSLGDPIQELGSFAASLYYRALMRGEPLKQAEANIETFIEGYAAHVDWEVPPFSLNFYTAAALIAERASRSITRIKAQEPETIERIIDLAEQLLRHDTQRNAEYRVSQLI